MQLFEDQSVYIFSTNFLCKIHIVVIPQQCLTHHLDKVLLFPTDAHMTLMTTTASPWHESRFHQLQNPKENKTNNYKLCKINQSVQLTNRLTVNFSHTLPTHPLSLRVFHASNCQKKSRITPPPPKPKSVTSIGSRQSRPKFANMIGK